MRAYHHILTTQNDVRHRLIAPLSFQDQLAGILISKGVDPTKVSGDKKSHPKEVKAAVRVSGGSASPAMIQMAETYAAVNQRNHICETTGASRASVDFWFDPNR